MPLRIPSELIGDLRQGFHCSRRVLREIIKRIDKDEDFRKAWRDDVTPDFFKDLTDNLIDGANNLLFIFGVAGSGKSIVGMSVLLYQESIFQEKLKQKVVRGFCRNYGRANIIKAKIHERGAKGIILLDEDVRLTGFEAQVVRDNFFNNLDTMRIEQTCVIICSPKHRKDILVPNIQRWFGCLEVLMKNRRKHEDLCVWYSREGAEGKVYAPVYPDHPLWKWIEAWKKREQEKQTAALGGSAAETWPLRRLAEDILEKAHNEFPDASWLKPKDFETAAELMREEDNVVLSTHKTEMACQLAFRMHESNSKKGAPSDQKTILPTQVSSETSQVPIADGGEINVKYTDEGFEKNELQNLEEFKQLWLDSAYFIPPRTTEEGDPSNYPDVIGVLRDGSIGLLNAKYWNWRPGDILYTHKKMKSELLWHDKLKDLGFTENIRVMLLIKHKATGLTQVIEIPVEKAKTGTYPVRLPNPSPSSPNLPSPNTEKKKKEAAEGS